MNAASACCYSTQKKHTARVHHVHWRRMGAKPPAQAPGGQGWRRKSRTPEWARWRLPARLSSPGDKPPAQVHVQDQMNPLNRLRDLHRAGSSGTLGRRAEYPPARPHSHSQDRENTVATGPHLTHPQPHPHNASLQRSPRQMCARWPCESVHTSSAHHHKAPCVPHPAS